MKVSYITINPKRYVTYKLNLENIFSNDHLIIIKIGWGNKYIKTIPH